MISLNILVWLIRHRQKGVVFNIISIKVVIVMIIIVIIKTSINSSDSEIISVFVFFLSL